MTLLIKFCEAWVRLGFGDGRGKPIYRNTKIGTDELCGMMVHRWYHHKCLQQ